MKRYLRYLIFLLVLFLIEASATRVFGETLYLVPGLLLCFVIIFALTHSFSETLWMSFATGFLHEIFSGNFFGAQIVALVLIGSMVYLVTRKLTPQEITLPVSAFAVGVGTMLLVILVFAYLELSSVFHLTSAVSLRSVFSWRIIWTVVVNLIFFYPIRFILIFLER